MANAATIRFIGQPGPDQAALVDEVIALRAERDILLARYRAAHAELSDAEEVIEQLHRQLLAANASAAALYTARNEAVRRLAVRRRA